MSYNMHHPSQNTFDPQLVWQNIVHRPARWAVPATAIAVLALGYAIVRSPKWEAKQALVVRDEAVGRLYTSQGKFASVDDMQTAQETVLQLAKSHSVVEAAMRQVARAESGVENYQPSPADIEKLRGKIKVTAPNGAEFGRTEVFYLIVENKDRERAKVLSAAICDALEDRLGQLRDEKAQSLIAEMEQTVALTRSSLDEATQRLAALESEIGSDLPELRILNESSSGESTLRRTITNIRDELRAERKVQLANQQLMELLQDSQDDPETIVAMPSQLLQSQPALQRLKDGLVDAQLRTSQSLGLMSPAHPQVQAAMAEEKDVRRRLHGELSVALRGLKVELNMNDRRIASLADQLADAQQRMNDIAGVRAEYHNLAADVEQRTVVYSEAQRDLADAQASRAAAHSASLITRLDGPQAGAYPAGTSRSMIAAAGMVGGLFIGLSIVVLTATPVVLPQSTATDHRHSEPAGNLSLKDALMRVALGTPART